jgi:ApeA N-terminal domain 1/Apea-like HEPN
VLEPFEYRGQWWLPEHPQHKVAGVLTFSQSDIALELIGSLPREQSAPDPSSGEVVMQIGPQSRERILGSSTDGKLFTLEQCHSTAFNFAFPGIATERFVPALILEGAVYEAGEPVVFDELSVRYTQLDGWVAATGFTSKPVADADRETGIDVSFRTPPSVEVALPDATVKVAFAWATRHKETEVSVTQHATLRVGFKEPTPLEAALVFVNQLGNFVALGVGRPVAPLALSGVILSSADLQLDPSKESTPRKQEINVFYRLMHVPRDRQPAQQMLFTLEDARDRFGDLLQSWFAKQELLRPVVDLYFGAIYNPHSYLEQRFLSLMQAIETYHRRTSAETDLPPEEHAHWLEEILEATPEQYRGRLETKLKHSNELALRKRLNNVLRRCPEVAKKLAHRVTTARNYLTHYNRELAGEAPKGIELYPLTVQLQALVEMCLLLELGFTCEEIDRQFDRVRRYEEANL